MQLNQKNIKNNNLLLNINNLNVFFKTPEGISHVVKDANFNLKTKILEIFNENYISYGFTWCWQNYLSK